MTFVRRNLDFTFTLGKGSFGEDVLDAQGLEANTVKLTGLRAQVSVSKNGGVSMAQAHARLYGMSLSDMNRLSTLGKPLTYGRNNTVTIEARNEGESPATVFIGTINEAWVDMDAAPDAAFEVSAFTGLLDALKPIDPSSFQGQASVADILSGLAQQMGLTFENTGVDIQLANPYFPGTAREQALACAQAADINILFDLNILAIWPKGQSRGGEIPLINKETGMVGYPAHTQNGILVRTLFNPSIAFGARLKVESVLEPAAGEWTVFGLTHQLASETPGGPWFTEAQCTVLEHAPLAS